MKGSHVSSEKKRRGFPRVKEYIRGTCGTGEHEGPHSYKTYLKYVRRKRYMG